MTAKGCFPAPRLWYLAAPSAFQRGRGKFRVPIFSVIFKMWRIRKMLQKYSCINLAILHIQYFRKIFVEVIRQCKLFILEQKIVVQSMHLGIKYIILRSDKALIITTGNGLIVLDSRSEPQKTEIKFFLGPLLTFWVVASNKRFNGVFQEVGIVIRTNNFYSRLYRRRIHRQ